MRPRRTLARIAITILVLSAGVTSASADTQVRCSETDVPVTYGLLLHGTVHGQLCVPPTTTNTVQLLVHGGTYNRYYWDIPYNNGSYSYQRDMAANGVATFAVDALGSGRSTQPLSELITGTTEASAMHQVIQALRAGAVGGSQFSRVVIVGHSMGSGVTVLEATGYHDVDGVVLTGMTHSMDLLALTGVFVDGVRPALLDPVLSQRSSDPGYVTTMPGTRQVFHNPGLVEPGVLAADETTKDQVAATVVPDLLTLAFESPLSRSINVPVLIANGASDGLFCAFVCASEDTLRAAESPYFTAPLEVHLTPQAGHAVALSTNAADHREAIRAWMDEHSF
ncbi:alpha/beta hydrolase [Actinocrispum wychmicini]|uniref:Alpha-beta hydrolase superfamily lysophospholipase n=1 Tax=Actinocrispum wychmicini TaxID=1213861 RepID=A0A4R2IN81_9PSEU|nr:alpha/beta fold hydrolase [Actinocrispum wychmicini]TCO46533.1 alpha-beta hydrolase superfamily lysophospholipase [Actinocrispum wychmicini]